MADRLQLAVDAATRFHAAEEAIDKALAETAGLLAHLPQLRQAAGVSAVVGQDVFDRLAEASVGLTSARRAMVGGHNSIDRVRRALRLPPVLSAAPSGDKPPQDFTAWADAGEPLEEPAFLRLEPARAEGAPLPTDHARLDLRTGH